MMITLIDYGGSNLRSVQKAFEFVGYQVNVTTDPEEILRAEKLVLPGVGAFAPAMAALRQRSLDQAIHAAATDGIPLLGICLGMQLLFDCSQEMGRYQGLGLIGGDVVRFSSAAPKIPHIGWNQIEPAVPHPLLSGLPGGSYAYFVHSFYCRPADPKDVIATTNYGGDFAAIAGHDNVIGIQFHPEKSQNIGLRVLQNFVRMN